MRRDPRGRRIRGGLLVSSTRAFAESGGIVPYVPFKPPGNPPVLSSRGIYLELCFIGLNPQGLALAILHCRDIKAEHLIAIYVRDMFLTMDQLRG